MTILCVREERSKWIHIKAARTTERGRERRRQKMVDVDYKAKRKEDLTEQV